MASRTDEMVRHLKALQMNTPDIEASAVVSVDGLIMASQLPADVEEDRVSAMSAAMLSLGDRIANELKRGQLDQGLRLAQPPSVLGDDMAAHGDRESPEEAYAQHVIAHPMCLSS